MCWQWILLMFGFLRKFLFLFSFLKNFPPPQVLRIELTVFWWSHLFQQYRSRHMVKKCVCWRDRSCFVVQFWPTRFKRQERFCPLGKERHVNKNPIFLQFPPQPRQYTWRHEFCNYSSQLGNIRRWPGHWMAKSRETIHRSSLQYWVTSSRIINVYVV